MTEPPTLLCSYYELAKTCITLLLGGVIGIVGATVPKIVEWWLNTRKESHGSRQRRIEDAIRRVYEFNDWIDDYVNVSVFNKPSASIRNSEAELVILTKIYISELEQEWAALDARAAEYKSWALQAAQKRLKATPSPVNPAPPPLEDLTAGFSEVYNAYRAAFVAFERKVVDIARKKDTAV